MITSTHFVHRTVFSLSCIFIVCFFYLPTFSQTGYIPKYAKDINAKIKKDSRNLYDNGWVELSIDVDTSDFFNRYADDLGLSTNKKLSLKKFKEEKDPIGIVHQRYQLYYDNIRVEGLEYSLHSKNGKVSTANGRIVSTLSIDVKNLLPLKDILLSLNLLLGTKLDIADLTPKDLKAKTNGELVIFNKNIADFTPTNFQLVYKIRGVTTKDPVDYVDLYVDARNGSIIQKNSIIQKCFSTQNGITNVHSSEGLYLNSLQAKPYRMRQPFSVDNSNFLPLSRYSRFLSGQTNISFQTNSYSSYNSGRSYLSASISNNGDNAGIVYTKKFNGQDPLTLNNHVDQDNQWYNNIPDVVNPSFGSNWGSYEQEATTSHWVGIRSAEYFQKVHGRKGSIDNYSSTTRILANIPEHAIGNPNYFYGPSFVEYGNYEGTDLIIIQSPNGQSWATVDVLGHEYTHGVTKYSSNLVYRGESGALNEAVSDIFGTCVERAVLSNSWNWLIGEDFIPGTGLRDMRVPRNGNQPDTYLGLNWEPTTGDCSTGDHCGVHTNSGVLNRWFNLIGEGGSQNGFSVNAIPFDHAEHIVYVAFTYYVHSQDAYVDARAATIQAAINLYGSCSNEYRQVVSAWGAVGLQIASSCPVDCNFAVNPSASSSSCGTQGTLSANCSGAGCSDLTYSWTGSNNFSASGASVQFTVPAANGSYQYTVSAAKAGCGTVTVSTPVNVNNCGGGTNGCSQQAISVVSPSPNQTLTASSFPFYFDIRTQVCDPQGVNQVQYSINGNWAGYVDSPDNNSTQPYTLTAGRWAALASSNNAFTINQPGTYTIQPRLFSNAGGYLDAAPVQITVVQGGGSNPPNPGGGLAFGTPAFDCGSGQLVLTTTGGDGTPVEFQAIGLQAWSTNNVIVIPAYQRNGYSFTIQARQSGTEIAPYTFPTSCAGYRLAALEDTPAETLTIMPNPTTGRATVRFRLAAGQSAVLHLVNTAGAEVNRRAVVGTGKAQEESFNLDREPAGLYVLSLESGTTRLTGKVMLQR